MKKFKLKIFNIKMTFNYYKTKSKTSKTKTNN